MNTHNNSGNTRWQWSEEHRKYYRCQPDRNGGYMRDGSGQYIYEWAEQNFEDQRSESHVQNDTSAGAGRPPQEQGNYTLDTQSEAAHQDNLGVPSERIRGTPGVVEELDHRYTMKFGAEEHRFFKQGRVFAMLWTETAGETYRRRSRTDTDNSRMTELRYPDPAISSGRFGQDVYSGIRRFVIVKVNREAHFVLACPITTYGKRGVMKPGCNAKEHTIVHFRGRPASYLPGEYQRGMTKDPLMIDPTDPAEEMSLESRLRLGKVVSVECNVKVRDIGMVIREHRSKLLAYYKQEQENGYEPDEYEYEHDVATPRSTPVPPPFTHGGYGASASSTHGAYYAPNGLAYNTYPSTREAHGSYPNHSGYQHGESQTYQAYPPYQYPPHQHPPHQPSQYQHPPHQYPSYQHPSN